MKSKPEIDKASTAPTVKALNEESQRTKKGTIVSNSTVVPANSQPVFNFGDNQVRLVVCDGEPWFVAADVCKALGYRDAEKGTRNLSTHQKADTQIVGSSSGGVEQLRKVTIINESGLYRLVLRSRKPEAEKFSDWVTGEVLPSIRKTGQYQQTVVQGNQSIDCDRISPAQAQDLKEIVNAIAEAKIQPHGESWKRFQNKFRVNSYLQLPSTLYEEARAYLIAKLPAGYASDLFEKEPEPQLMDLALVESAMTAANAVAAQVQKQAFMAMVKSTCLQRGRWTVSFGYRDDGAAPNVREIDDGSFIGTLPQMAKLIQDPGTLLESQDLMDLAKACMNRLATHLEARALAA